MKSANRIVVAGATGRVGSLVISELLNREDCTFVVRALVRDLEKAKKTLPAASARLEIVKCDLGAKSDIAKACKDSDALIWCATGFSDNSSKIDQFLALFKLKFTPKESIDVAALSQIGQIFSRKITEESTSPQVNSIAANWLTKLHLSVTHYLFVT
jgi:dihydrodipicolinate reductase